MNKEDKELLLKDLCSRLPYGVVGLIHNVNCDDYNISITGGDIDLLSHHFITIKPYLRPMSSMTEEEKKFYIEISSHLCGEIAAKTMIDWLNSHHFDYRGLIEKGLAIAVTEDNNPYKT